MYWALKHSLFFQYNDGKSTLSHFNVLNKSLKQKSAVSCCCAWLFQCLSLLDFVQLPLVLHDVLFQAFDWSYRSETVSKVFSITEVDFFSMCNRLLLNCLMNYNQYLKREGMQAWAVPAILKSREYAHLKPEDSDGWILFPLERVLALLKVPSAHLLLLCSAQPCLAVCVPALAHQQCGTVCRGCTAGVSSLPALGEWIRRSVVAFVMILFVSAGLSYSALTSPQNIQLFGFVALFKQCPSIHWGVVSSDVIQKQIMWSYKSSPVNTEFGF